MGVVFDLIDELLLLLKVYIRILSLEKQSSQMYFAFWLFSQFQ